MEQFWIFTGLGREHVLDGTALDHVLFMAALAAPYSLANWRKAVWLATVFTIAHCTSLVFSAYGWLTVDAGWIEFLIPVTIMATAMNNIYSAWKGQDRLNFLTYGGAALFGVIHGFGFSNYFNMMVFGLEQKIVPLLGFAIGIEIAQVIVILSILMLSWAVLRIPKVDRRSWIWVVSSIVLVQSLPMLAETFRGLVGRD